MVQDRVQGLNYGNITGLKCPIIYEIFLDQVNDYQLLKEDPVPWC
jgi:hypothetical protein